MTSNFLRSIAMLMTLAACGCASQPLPPAGPGANFDPIAFFKGHTHGDGQLKKLFSAPVSVTVDSVGRTESGALILDQTIRQANKPPSVRRWTIRRVGHGRYTGTLTDAVGEVRATVAGPRADIRYNMRHGFNVEQQLTLQADERTVANRLVVHKFGARVATLSETIRKSD